MTPDFLAIGHVAKDLAPGGFRLGGAVTYGSLTALKLGARPAAVASAGKDVDIAAALPDMPVHVVPADATTTFDNIYTSSRSDSSRLSMKSERRQIIQAVGGTIEPADIPNEWRAAPLVMLGPLVPHMSYELARCFDNAIIVACLQGWMRQWDDKGHISPARWTGEELLPYVDAAILAVEDFNDDTLLDIWKKLAPVLIVTKGREGAELHMKGRWHHIDAFPAKEVDPTGAGDVFAAAYLIRLGEMHREPAESTDAPLEAARFASCAASLSVEAHATDGIPTRAQVEARLRYA